MASRPSIVPLTRLINHKFGLELSEQITPLPGRMSVDFFSPGRPRAKDRGVPKVTASGKAYTMVSSETTQKEIYIRECFLEAMHNHYLDRAQFLPILEGWAHLEIYSFMPPPNRWYPGLAHTGPP